MSRPRKIRRIHGEPGALYFKPRGIPLTNLEESVLEIEEFEAIRLADEQELNQSECAKKMSVSQPTFNRILTSAHKKIAEAMVNGKAIRIEQ